MLNMFLFLSGMFILTLALGKLIEKIRVPWIFAALLIGTALSVKNPFQDIISSQAFTFLARLGMYLLLFVIGFELDLNKLKKTSSFILKSTFFIIPIEAFFGSLLIHFVFGYSWLMSIIVAISFATVGEAILVPILDEFKIINSKLGHSIIGIGTLDDLIEVALLVVVVFLVGSKLSLVDHVNTAMIIISLGVLFGLTFTFTKLKKKKEKFMFLDVNTMFVFVLFVLFLFIGIGAYADVEPLAAILAGIAIKTFVPDKRVKEIEHEVKTVCYGLFAPIFFLWVGSSLNLHYLIKYPIMVLLVVLVSSAGKLIASLVAGVKELGFKQALLLGVGLSARFSTSIIIVKILLDSGFIDTGLYSIIVSSSIIFTFVIPVLFANLLARFKVGYTKS